PGKRSHPERVPQGRHPRTAALPPEPRSLADIPPPHKLKSPVAIIIEEIEWQTYRLLILLPSCKSSASSNAQKNSVSKPTSRASKSTNASIGSPSKTPKSSGP